jgi:Asp-tRNA(Asn)/Glu-tRNA(Gln) amidotransferase A subunit family amidase
VLLKDNVDTRDQRTTAGSRALLKARPGDATSPGGCARPAR